MDDFEEEAFRSETEDKLLGDLLTIIGEDPGKPPSLEQLEKEAQGYGKRRADRLGSRDNLIYRAGYAIDSLDGLAVEPEVLAGVLSDSTMLLEALESLPNNGRGWAVILVIHYILGNNPSLIPWARQVGRSLQWSRLNALQQDATASFKASGAFADPEAKWRRRPATRKQRYLISEIVRLTELEPPVIKTCEEAFNFVEKAGGNPRFWARPSNAARPALRWKS